MSREQVIKALKTIEDIKYRKNYNLGLRFEQVFMKFLDVTYNMNPLLSFEQCLDYISALFSQTWKLADIVDLTYDDDYENKPWNDIMLSIKESRVTKDEILRLMRGFKGQKKSLTEILTFFIGREHQCKQYLQVLVDEAKLVFDAGLYSYSEEKKPLDNGENNNGESVKYYDEAVQFFKDSNGEVLFVELGARLDCTEVEAHYVVELLKKHGLIVEPKTGVFVKNEQ